MELKSKLPPQDIAAEISVLGSGILHCQSLCEIAPFLSPDDFYRGDHQLIYKCMLDLFAQNTTIDLVVLADELKTRKVLGEVGDVDYLVTLAESVPSSANIRYYAEIVKRKSVARQLIKVLMDGLSKAYDDDPEELLESLESNLFKLTTDDGPKNTVKTLKECSEPVIAEIIEKKEDRVGLSTGFDALDRRTGGLHKAEMIVVAARPSIGKTALAFNIAEHVSYVQNRPVLAFSVEMSAQQLVNRFLVKFSGIDSQQLRSGLLSNDDISLLVNAHNEYSKAPLYIDDKSSLTPMQMLSRARHLAYTHDVSLIIIDYLQLVRGLKGMNRFETVTYVSSESKHMARELDVPVILVSQLNRATENRDGKRPRMSDLRDSGAIEQDADVVLLLYREDYYQKDLAKFTNVGEIDIAKQRQGQTGIVELGWDGPMMSWVNLNQQQGEMF